MNRVKITNRRTKRNLKEVIRVLDGVIEHNKRFNMYNWASRRNVEDCNTSACAIGYAAQDSWFNYHGLYLTKDGYYERLYPTYAGHQEFKALSVFFAISLKQAEYLFYAGSYNDTGNGITADRVRRRINYILKRGFPV